MFFFLLLMFVDATSTGNLRMRAGSKSTHDKLKLINTSKEKVHVPLPSCNGCFSGFNGIYYACCNDMTINNGYCTCDGDVPCTQCSPSKSDKEKVIPQVSEKEKVYVPLPSCNGCFSGFNGIYYACCNDMTINNGYCTCDGDVPCTQCSPSMSDKEKVILHEGDTRSPSVADRSDFCFGVLHPYGPDFLPSAGLCISRSNGFSNINGWFDGLNYFNVDISSGSATPANFSFVQTQWDQTGGSVQICFCEAPRIPNFCNGPPTGAWFCLASMGNGQSQSVWGLFSPIKWYVSLPFNPGSAHTYYSSSVSLTW